MFADSGLSDGVSGGGAWEFSFHCRSLCFILLIPDSAARNSSMDSEGVDSPLEEKMKLTISVNRIASRHCSWKTVKSRRFVPWLYTREFAISFAKSASSSQFVSVLNSRAVTCEGRRSPMLMLMSRSRIDHHSRFLGVSPMSSQAGTGRRPRTIVFWMAWDSHLLYTCGSFSEAWCDRSTAPCALDNGLFSAFRTNSSLIRREKNG